MAEEGKEFDIWEEPADKRRPWKMQGRHRHQVFSFPTKADAEKFATNVKLVRGEWEGPALGKEVETDPA
jgi:hypothetical protein